VAAVRDGDWPGEGKALSAPANRKLAEAREVEVDGDGVAFGRGDLDGGGVGFEGAGSEFKLDGRAAEDAAAVAVAGVDGVPRRA
jgi:hypothetical protein